MEKKFFKSRNHTKPSNTLCVSCNKAQKGIGFYWECTDCDKQYISCNSCYLDKKYKEHICFITKNVEKICGGFMLSESSRRSGTEI